ncbi:MAG: SusD/RagB family nutrient-binding outer membrane lipoprotein [Bacteroidetes bacterium]|nr:SusD/RagB family nutrient-binding outer membrane lipoprotein [Bacteroidota bacterium]
MSIKFKYILPLILAAGFVGSCSKSTFDINTDPNNPSTLPAKNLLPGIESTLGSVNAIGNIGDITEVYMHRISVREDPNAYGVTGNSGYVDNMWDPYYAGLLTNANIIISKSTAAGNFKYSGIAKVIKAYAFSQLVDLFGDIPYAEATKLTDGNLNPKFDDDATIYPSLLALLDQAIADLNNTAANPSSPGADDVIYQGKVANWVKAANTLKLKLYTQERRVTNVTAAVTALLASPATLIASTADNFQVPFSKDNQNPGYGDYGAAQRTKYISPWFYETLMGYRPEIFTGITDPRIPYYWFNQLKPGQTATNDGNPTEYRDGPFLSIYFGSNGPNSGFAQQNSQTVLGIYPVGGKYDDKSGSGSTGTNKLNSASASGAAPMRLITYADRLFLEAELIQTGVIAGDARAKLLAAITEAMKQVDAVVTKTGTAGVPVLAGSAGATAYITAIMNYYDANPSKSLQIIMTQKWISSFGSSVDAYTDYRRTGFPIIWDPNSNVMAPGGYAQPPIHGNPLVDPQLPVKVSANRAFPLSLPWPNSELVSNKNAPAQKQPSTYKVFWQP